MTAYDPPLDPGIAAAVHALNDAGIETFTSCEGGEGHAFPEPTVRFYGDADNARKAARIVFSADTKPHELRRVWALAFGYPHAPLWELVFFKEEPPEHSCGDVR